MRRGGLVRRYLIVLVALVTGALVVAGAVQLRAAYLESQAALVALQREKAHGAAARIEAFVRDIERQLGWTTHAPLMTTDAALDQRQLDALRLQRQAPPITELAYIDASGREQLFVSRLVPDRRRSGLDVSQEPRFRETRRGPWFGPVYFRKDSEPYMTIAAPLSGGGIAAADVNLKFILDVVARIKVGTTGLAYAVDRQGVLIAHPDISLVLQKTSLAELAQVKTALSPAPDDDLTVARDVKGVEVLTAHSRIPTLGWVVFVEQPVAEAFAPIRASAYRVGLLVLGGIAFSVVASVVLARHLARPIQALQQSAARIGAGELDHRIELRTGDEVEALADEFNRMTTRLRESYATLEQRVEDRTRELRESLEQQTATAEILRVISSSPTDVQPVFETILTHATRLCAAERGIAFTYDGEHVVAVACRGLSAEAEAEFRTVRRVTATSGLGRMLASRRPVQVEDLTDDPAFRAGDPLRLRTVHLLGARTAVWLPLLKGDEVMGALAIYRQEVRRFGDKQIELVQTFADQAVIAIENVRLFKELETKNRTITEALEQQTATAEILGVISSSPTDVQPVLDAVASSAARLCGATDALILRVDDGLMRRVAHFGTMPSVSSEARPITSETPSGRAIVERRMIHVADIREALATGDYAEARALHEATGFRTVLSIPLLREETVIGVITIRRDEVLPFTDKQIALVKTFADQAVIAIENVRLFRELEAKNRALTETLEQQTATSEILRVISGSLADVQPVFDAIARSAVSLGDGSFSCVMRYDGARFHIVARHRVPVEVEELFPIEPRGLVKEMLEGCRTIASEDVPSDPRSRYPGLTQAIGYRSAVFVPMLRDGTVIGAIMVGRTVVKPFTAKQIALLETFADQAVIAVENARLFTELQARTAELTRSVSELEALGEVGRAISSTLDLDRVLETIVSRANALAGTDGGAIYEFDEAARAFHLRATQDFPEEFVAGLRTTRLVYGEGAVGRAAAERQPVQIPDVRDPAVYESRVRDLLLRSGYLSLLAVPLLSEDEVVGALVVNRRMSGEFPSRVVDLMRTFATQSAVAIVNARLFREIEDKSRELEAANRHKDEFLASMSHELRTPLNAVIGFSEVLLERMFGDVNEKQEEYLNDILASGRHLLSLINDILDLAKIEAGRMELDVEDFELVPAIENALVLIRERATRKGLALDTRLDAGLGTVRGDQRKIKQVLLNLLSNAVKFTPEGGRVEVHAGRVDGQVEINVVDTGIGIAPEDHEAVFEEFRQVGTDYAKKHEGTGLGLALSRKFVELHGGRIWLKSRPGEGSTFTFTLPVRHGQ